MNTTNENIGTLSNSALLDRVTQITRKEIGTTVELLLHLNEVDKRKLYLELAHNSLFSYLVSDLNYCKGAAYRRIASARLAEAYPDAYRYLYSRELSLTTAALVSGVCLKQTKEEGRLLLESIRGKSKSEVEELLAKQRPVSKVREQLKPITLQEKPKPCSKAGTLFSPPPVKQNSKKKNNVFLKTPEKESLVSPENPVSATNPREALYQLSFVINPEAKNKLERVQTLMSNKGAKSLESVFSVLLETYLDKHCPERRSVRREKRKAKKKNAKPKSRILNRHIPAQIRDQVFKRDGLRCTYVSPEGVRCEAR